MEVAAKCSNSFQPPHRDQLSITKDCLAWKTYVGTYAKLVDTEETTNSIGQFEMIWIIVRPSSLCAMMTKTMKMITRIMLVFFVCFNTRAPNVSQLKNTFVPGECTLCAPWGRGRICMHFVRDWSGLKVKMCASSRRYSTTHWLLGVVVGWWMHRWNCCQLHLLLILFGCSLSLYRLRNCLDGEFSQ